MDGDRDALRASRLGARPTARASARRRFPRSAILQVRVDGEWSTAGGWDGPETVTGDGFRCAVDRNPHVSMRIARTDGRAFRPERIRLELALPLLNYGRVIVPDCGRHYVNSTKALDIRAPLHGVFASNIGHPFFALADEAGEFLFAFGLLDVDGEVQVRRQRPLISTRGALVGGDESLVREVSWRGPERPVGALTVAFFADESGPTWFHALRSYADTIAQREGIHPPEHPDAWRPTWCTWTAFSSRAMGEDRILENARIAKELGIGTIIIDDGWFGPGLDDDVAAPLTGGGTGRLTVGDYEPDEGKLPDLPGLVRRLQGLGMKVLLWHAPLCVAPTSRAYEALRRYLIRHEDGEYTSVNGLAQLCPACPDVRTYVAEETERLLTAYGVDGLKVDLYNCLPDGACTSSEHSHDVLDPVRAVEATMRAQWERATSVKPDVLVELKQDYGNVRLSRYGTMLRAGDTAHDADTNCRRCFYIQAYAPCVHNDYLITGPETTPRAMGLLMVRALTAGVPTFGNDLTTLGAELRTVVRKWLDFYRAHLAMFRGRREPLTGDLSMWRGGSGDEAWVSALWHACELHLPEARVTYVLNGTGREWFYVRLPEVRRCEIERYDHLHAPTYAGACRLEDGTRIAVPSGGYALVRRLGERAEPDAS